MPHVDDGTLHALLDGALRAEEPERADEVEAHLEMCADCRARLEKAGKLRGLASDILASLDAEIELQLSPDFQDVVDRASGYTGEPAPAVSSDRERVLRRYRWTRGLAWAATVIVALGTGYLVRDLAGPTAQHPQQDRVGNQIQAPAARADAMESEAPERGDAAAFDRATGGEEARSEETRQVAERRAAAPVEPEAEIAEPPQAAPAAQTMAPEADLDHDGGALRLADEVPSAPVWVAAEVTEVEDRVGTILVLPNAEIGRTELLQGNEAVARTFQVLPTGVEVQVIQSPAARGETGEGQPADADAPLAAALEPVKSAPTAAEAEASAGYMEARLRAATRLDSVPADTGPVHTVHWAGAGPGGVTLTLTGPLPQDVLEALAAAAAPRQR